MLKMHVCCEANRSIRGSIDIQVTDRVILCCVDVVMNRSQIQGALPRGCLIVSELILGRKSTEG